MLYLDSISVHNFKSFRHANIKLLKGFNCILGPNGSGKSNICDSILFALGENSLKRLRVSKSEQLIHGGAKTRDDGVRKAYVKLLFTGERALEVSRVIKSNGKIGYRIDGKRARRQDVIDVLRSYRCSVEDTNVIAQGEISYMQSLSPKERRELIDVAAGIREFDEKKSISLKELEKVDTKIREAQIELGLKQGFLKDLEKQKSDAESYLSHKDYITRGTYTILKAREQEISANYEISIQEISTAQEKITKINETLLKLEASISKTSIEKAAYSKELNEKSVEVSSTNRKLEEIEKEKAVKESESRSIKERIEEKDNYVQTDIDELDSFKSKTKKGIESEEQIKNSLKIKESELGSNSLDELIASESGTSGILDIYTKNQKDLDALQTKQQELSSRTLKIAMELGSLEDSAKESQSTTIQSKADLQGFKEKASAFSKEIELIGQSKLASKKSIDMQLSKLSEERKSLESLDSKMLELKEQLAMSGASTESRIEEELKKGIKSGFHGAAHSLCTYDEKYDAAVNASAASRLNYFVVESKDTAEKAIALLKSKQLGRASFIPLDFVSSQEQRDTTHDLLISHIEFDKKYEKAFRYVFSNTCIVKSMADVKKSDLSKNRFVTYEGELIEQSGVISGGSQRRHTNASSIRSRLIAMDGEKRDKWQAIGRLEAELEAAKRGYSELEGRELNLSYEFKRATELGLNSEKIAKEKEASVAAISKSIESIKKEKASKDAELQRLNEQIQSLKDENESVLKKSKGASKPKESKETDISKYKAITKEIEELKVVLGATVKENQMYGQRSREIESEIATFKDNIKADRGKLAILDSDLMELSKARAELQDEIRAHGAKYGSLMTKMNSMDEQISKASMEKGKAVAEMNRAEREIGEVNTKRVKLQTRLADIKAELSSLQKVDPIVGEEIPNIETKISKAKIQIEILGAVNLKAPEIYSEKKAEVSDAEQKMSVLGSEKESIINMIKEIDSKKLGVFKETFAQVNEHFRRMHNYVFDSDAYLQLDNQKDPLSSGLNIVVSAGRNKGRVIEQFSGGEKTLLILMLIFSIQMRNPLSFYIFDEIDTSLDKENVKKLSKLVGELSKSSQMIVVSHNDTMITAADSAIGVVRRSGDSSAIGLQIGSGAKVGA